MRTRQGTSQAGRARTSKHVVAGALLALGLAAYPATSHAATLQVGPGKTYAKPCLAIAAAAAGDVIEVDAAGSANYKGDTCAWSTNNLTIRGVNGRPKLDITGTTPAQQKGLFTISAVNATIENLEFTGAAISVAAGNNGAGIRHQGTNLTVRGCYFHDNQNGILGSPATANTGNVLIESSEFEHNGAGDGFSHAMYLGNYAQFTLQYSYSHRGNVGHLVKSRGNVNRILYNRLTDEVSGASSYELNLPNAGTSYVIGNVIQQAATTQNPALIAYGEEGVPAGYDAHLYVVNNTFLNNRAAGGTFINNATTTPAVITNNIFYNAGTITSQASAMQTSNFVSATMGDPKFAAVATYDVRLLAGSPAIDKGTDPGSASGQALQAVEQYLHPTGHESRGISGSAVDVGAYEFGNPGMPGQDGGSAGADMASAADASTDPPDGMSTGCSCNLGATAATSSWPAIIGGALLLLRLRRRIRPAAR